jgi:hypothetical protein
MKIYVFRTVRLSVIRSLFTVYSAMLYVTQGCRQFSNRNICSCSKAVYKPVWHISLLSVLWINSWWWTDELSETCRVSWQNKFVKLVHLVGFITNKFVTMHGHMNVKQDISAEPVILLGWVTARTRQLNYNATQSIKYMPRVTLRYWKLKLSANSTAPLVDESGILIEPLLCLL